MTFGFDLKCSFEARYWSFEGQLKTCVASSVNVTTSNEAITSINGGTETHFYVLGFWVEDQQVSFIPSGIEKFLPNLKGILVRKSKLQAISQSDLKPFPSLQVLILDHNDITVLHDNLFEYNQQLKVVSFKFNSKLRSVGRNVLPNQLTSATFDDAGCLDHTGFYAKDFEVLNRQIEQNCGTPEHPKKSLFDEESDGFKEKATILAELDRCRSRVLNAETELHQTRDTIDTLRNKCVCT